MLRVAGALAAIGHKGAAVEIMAYFVRNWLEAISA